GILIGAAALASFALWLHLGAEREHATEGRGPTLPSNPCPEASASTELVSSEGSARETLDTRDALRPRENALRVDVVDATGLPAAGVPIACGVISTSHPGAFEARLRARTDARGSASIERSSLPHPAPGSSDPSLRLRCEILAEPLPEIVLGPDAVEAEHVVLRLPPTGSVRLLLESETERSPRAARFAVWARVSGSNKDLDPLPRWISAPRGEAILDHVGLGLELRVA